MAEKYVVMSRGKKVRDKVWGEWGILYGERFPYTLETAERVMAEEIRLDSGQIGVKYEYEYRIQSVDGVIVEEATLPEKIGQYVAAGHGYNLSVEEARVVGEVFDVNSRLEEELSRKKDNYREYEDRKEKYLEEGMGFMMTQMDHAMAELQPEIKLLERILHG